tara:strand:+ start:6154 stop:6807 length:654 start_codon:yes stop_codon:yes gene_type:complete
MTFINSILDFVGSGVIRAGVDSVIFRDTYITNELPVAETGQASLDGRFVASSILGALNELVDGLNTTSGLVLADPGHTSINGLSGILTLTSPNGSILIGDGPQAIELSGLFTTTSGALVQQHSADLLILSGLILPTTASVTSYVEGVDTSAFVHDITHGLGTFDVAVTYYNMDPSGSPGVAQPVIICYSPTSANVVRVELDSSASGHFMVMGSQYRV